MKNPFVRNPIPKHFRSNRIVVFGASVIALFVVAALLAPVIRPGDPSQFVSRPNLPPGTTYPLGTTGSGQDVLAQTLWGARNSLSVGFIVGFATTFIAAGLGIASGYIGGRFDEVVSFITNVFLILPSLPLLITLAAFLPPGYMTILLVLVVTGWAWPTRVLRSQALTLRNRDFIAVAEVNGESRLHIVFFELLPNMLSIVVASFLGSVTYAIGAQASLEFLGLGNTSSVSWGTQLYWAQNNAGLLQGAWWTFVPPGLSIALVGFAMTLLNYGIDEITNPRLRSQRATMNLLRKQPRKIRDSRSTPVMRTRGEA